MITDHISWAKGPGDLPQNVPPAWGRARMFWPPLCPVLSWSEPLALWLISVHAMESFSLRKTFSRMVFFHWEPSHYKMYQVSWQKSSELGIRRLSCGPGQPWYVTLWPSAGFWTHLTGYPIHTHLQLPSALMPLLSSKVGKLSNHFFQPPLLPSKATRPSFGHWDIRKFCWGVSK